MEKHCSGWLVAPAAEAGARGVPRLRLGRRPRDGAGSRLQAKRRDGQIIAAIFTAIGIGDTVYTVRVRVGTRVLEYGGYQDSGYRRPVAILFIVLSDLN